MTTLARVRAWLMAALAFGVVGTFVELLLLGHYEEWWQLAPLVLTGLAMAGLAWHTIRPSARSVRALQGLMMLFLLAGIVGVGLHMRGAAEFQWEIDPSQPRWDVFRKVMQAKAPPALAPGMMVQLGLIGLIGLHHHAVSGNHT